MISLPEESSKTLKDEHYPLAGTSAQEFLQFWTEGAACEDDAHDRVEKSALHTGEEGAVAAFCSETHVWLSQIIFLL